MENKEIIHWLLEGDVSIQYQVHRDLLSVHREDLRNRIATEGWGYKYLSLQNKNGHWGRKFYQPKWTSTHYTLLDLGNLKISPKNPKIKKTINMLLEQEKGEDGGINPSRWKYDILRALDYFRLSEIPFDERMKPAIEVLIRKRKKSKFWLLQANHPGQTHFDMEEVGKPSRWNTLRALRVLKHFKIND